MSLFFADWYPATRESVPKGTPMAAYRSAKTLAEQALWEFADAHPHLDVTTGTKKSLSISIFSDSCTY